MPYPDTVCGAIGVRANIHLGGRPSFARVDSVGGVVAELFRDPNSVGGGGVVAEIFRIHILWGGRIFPLTAVTDPKFGFFFR